MNRTRSTPVVLLAAVAVSLAGGLCARASGSALEGRIVDSAFVSHGLQGTLHYEVLLPPGYATSSEHYPVVYFLHGLPAGSNAYRGAAAFVARAIEAIGGNAIVVAPQGALDGHPDPEYHDWGVGADWETALTEELPRVIDSRYRTIADRSGRALVGVSAGGYGATILALHHLPAFSVVESWSGYFHPTGPSGWNALDLGSAGKNAYASAHTIVPRLKQRFVQYPTYFAFYVGTDDDRFRPENEQLDRELQDAGVWHVFREYPGGHQTALWQAHARQWLGLALAHLARAR